ncbi:hypothetical protein T484DRAFT_1932124 [Baffinella frigidus]|nr:hypothetical protein T484DRAFT_1932124 [Cryptophyta sp. CCMP2293]
MCGGWWLVAVTAVARGRRPVACWWGAVGLGVSDRRRLPRPGRCRAVRCGGVGARREGGREGGGGEGARGRRRCHDRAGLGLLGGVLPRCPGRFCLLEVVHADDVEVEVIAAWLGVGHRGDLLLVDVEHVRLERRRCR